MKKKAFTLLELLIVIVIFGILSGIILKTYITITQIAFRLEQDKEIAKETLILSQVLENISQTATIDYSKYGENLVNNNGITDTLYLTGGNWQGVELFSTGDCKESKTLYEGKDYEIKDTTDTTNDESNENLAENTETKTCKLIMKQGNDENEGNEETKETKEITLLGGNNKYKISKIYFKVIPYSSTIDIINGNNEEGSENINAGKPAFRILGTVYSTFYNPKKWSNSSIANLQLFFNLKGATKSIYDYDISNDEN